METNKLPDDSIGQPLVSVPLRGLDMWKPTRSRMPTHSLVGFSPLAGIRYVETDTEQMYFMRLYCVSVPLRGLDMWKPSMKPQHSM